MELSELLERADRLTQGYASSDEALALIDAAIEIWSAPGEQQDWVGRYISHAITMAGWGLWRAVGAALKEAFEMSSVETIGPHETVTADDLKRLRAQID